MRATKPSFTARHVARVRAGLDRPTLPSGDADAERRLYEGLGSSPLSALLARRGDFHDRMARRTAFFDRETLAAIERGVPQVVIVGAGYDGRALRFADPRTRFFEVDHPATQADKRRRVAALGARPGTGATYVPADLIHDDLAGRLDGAGHDPARASLFVVEGLLGYLPRPTVDQVLTTLRARATPDSELAVALPTVRRLDTTRARLRHRWRAVLLRAMGEPRLSRFEPGEFTGVLARAGWRVAIAGGNPRVHQGATGSLVVAVPDPGGAQGSASPSAPPTSRSVENGR